MIRGHTKPAVDAKTEADVANHSLGLVLGWGWLSIKSFSDGSRSGLWSQLFGG